MTHQMEVIIIMGLFKTPMLYIFDYLRMTQQMEVIIIMGLFNPHVIYIRLRQDDSADGGYNHINEGQRTLYSSTVNQVIVTTIKLSKGLSLNH